MCFNDETVRLYDADQGTPHKAVTVPLETGTEQPDSFRNQGKEIEGPFPPAEGCEGDGLPRAYSQHAQNAHIFRSRRGCSQNAATYMAMHWPLASQGFLLQR